MVTKKKRDIFFRTHNLIFFGIAELLCGRWRGLGTGVDTGGRSWCFASHLQIEFHPVVGRDDLQWRVIAAGKCLKAFGFTVNGHQPRIIMNGLVMKED